MNRVYVWFAMFSLILISACKHSAVNITPTSYNAATDLQTTIGNGCNCCCDKDGKEIISFVCESPSGLVHVKSIVDQPAGVCANLANFRVAVIDNGVAVPSSIDPVAPYVASDGTIIFLPDVKPIAVLNIGDTDVSHAHALKVPNGQTPAVSISQTVISFDGVPVAHFIAVCINDPGNVNIFITNPSSIISESNMSGEIEWCPKYK